ncbi:MAG: hypothetical protein H6872_05945 [Methylobacteriaceae bacterium]|nr:hypothetical protein [Methylobacteriaceae bacterium]MCC0004692.1 hypothetical protein [Methylobacteriaceae bacterium]
MNAGDLVTLVPSTARERVTATRLGADGWTVREIRETFIFVGEMSALVAKNGHLRWMRLAQLRPNKAAA